MVPPSDIVERADAYPINKIYMQNVLRNYEKNNTVIIKGMSHEKALSYGENYVAEVYRVKVLGGITRAGKVIKYSKSVIVKRPLCDEQNIPREMFKFESKFYNSVMPVFDRDFKEILPVIRCLKAEETIVITEDFMDEGWVLPKHRESLSQGQLAKVVKSLAVFHAASIFLSKNEKSEIALRMMDSNVQDQVYSVINAPLCKKTFADSYTVAKYFADEYLPNANEAETAAIKQFFSQTPDEMYDKATQATEETNKMATVFVHGECWANNFMLKEDNSGDYALLINFTTVCQASPARDLIYLFATNSLTEFNKSALLRAYVDELQKNLYEQEVRMDVIELFTLEFMKSEMIRLKPVARLTAIWLLVAISYTSYPTVEEYNKLKREDKPQLVAEHVDKEYYVRRLMEIIREYA